MTISNTRSPSYVDLLSLIENGRMVAMTAMTFSSQTTRLVSGGGVGGSIHRKLVHIFIFDDEESNAKTYS